MRDKKDKEAETLFLCLMTSKKTLSTDIHGSHRVNFSWLGRWGSVRPPELYVTTDIVPSYNARGPIKLAKDLIKLSGFKYIHKVVISIGPEYQL